MKTINYYVIGGQYQCYCYGGAQRLRGAMQLATKSAEYWDNWQGWHIPAIYRAEDVEPIQNFYGEQLAPKPGAVPAAVGVKGNCKTVWTRYGEEATR